MSGGYLNHHENIQMSTLINDTCSFFNKKFQEFFPESKVALEEPYQEIFDRLVSEFCSKLTVNPDSSENRKIIALARNTSSLLLLTEAHPLHGSVFAEVVSRIANQYPTAERPFPYR